MDAVCVFKLNGMVDGKLTYRKGNLVLVPETMYEQRRQLKSATVTRMDEVFKQFKYDDATIDTVLISRAGGLGDLIALSQICSRLDDCNIKFYTQKSVYGEIFEWFVNKPEVFEHTDVIIPNYSYGNKIRGTYKHWGFADINGIVEKASNRNWYEVFCEQIGLEFTPELGRPALVSTPPKKYENYVVTFEKKDKKVLILCPKASAMMRTISLPDLYEGINSLSDNYDFWIHRTDFTDINDAFFCQNHGINIIEPCSLATALFNIYHADMVVSTDSMAVHFREGVGKKALAIYASFESACRTKHYTCTKSIDVKSDCDMQPCYLHEWRDGKRHPFCPKGIGNSTAPCLSGIGLIKEVERFIINNQNYF